MAQLLADIDVADGEQKFKLRAKLAAALQTFIDSIQFDLRDGIFDVILMGVMIAPRFKKSEPTGRGRARRVEYVGLVNVAQTMGDSFAPEAFHYGDRERMETLRRIIKKSS